MLIPVRAWASMTDRLIGRFIGVAASALLWMHVGYTSAEVLPVEVIDTHSDYNSTEHTNRTSRMAHGATIGEPCTPRYGQGSNRPDAFLCDKIRSAGACRQFAIQN